MNKPAILLMGPTATGKTELIFRLAKIYPLEVISVDSALVYKDMNIGTAKPKLEELNQVYHHLINIISPLESYSVANFIQDSVALIDAIHQRGNLPILVGGTMMYYNGLLNGISKLPKASPEIRAQLYDRGMALGFDKLHQELSVIDSISAIKIMPTDSQRIVRALEVFYLTSQPMSLLQMGNKEFLAKNFNFLKLAILPTSRAVLHSRINNRLDEMLNHGFIDEVLHLRNKYPELTPQHTSMRCVGYSQVWQYLLGQISYAELAEMAKASTRQLAKRQITWLRNMEIINLDDNDELNLEYIWDRLLSQIDRFLLRS